MERLWIFFVYSLSLFRSIHNNVDIPFPYSLAIFNCFTLAKWMHLYSIGWLFSADDTIYLSIWLGCRWGYCTGVWLYQSRRQHIFFFTFAKINHFTFYFVRFRYECTKTFVAEIRNNFSGVPHANYELPVSFHLQVYHRDFSFLVPSPSPPPPLPPLSSIVSRRLNCKRDHNKTISVGMLCII